MDHWHPILSAHETPPGVWTLIGQYDRVYGTIRFVRRGDEHGYRSDDKRGNLIGYYTTLLGASKAVHMRYLGSLTPGGPINGQ